MTRSDPSRLLPVILAVLLAASLAACAVIPPTPTPTPPAPSPTTTPSPAPASPSVTPTPALRLKVRVMAAPLLASPEASAPVLVTLPWLSEMDLLSGPDPNGYVGVRSDSGIDGFVLMDDLAKATDFLYADVPPMNAESTLPGYTGPARFTHLVDVRKEAPGISVQLLGATADNFMGVVLYERDVCLMQASTLKKLQKAQALFNADGFSIKIYDAYRPYSVTVRMAEAHPGSPYVASPKTGSKHNKGCAIDMTVTDLMGNELEMACPVDTLDARASRTYPGMSAAVRRNLDYVQGIMVRCGFTLNPTEWWHYNDSDHARYPVLDLRLGDVAMVVGEPPAITPPPLRDPAETGFVSLSPTPVP